MALTKEQIEKMDAALGKKASSPAGYASSSGAAYTGGLPQNKFSQMDKLLSKRAVASLATKKSEPEEKDALGQSKKWYKNPIGFLSSLLVEPLVKTAAKPIGEAVAGVYGLAGKEAPQWTEANRLASPELRSLKYGLGTAEQQAEAERLRQSGAQGAGFTDVLNAASILPAGGLARVAAGKGLLSNTARILPKGIVGKSIETGTELAGNVAKSQGFLKNAMTATKSAAPAATGWGAAYGLASGIDERKSATDTALSTLGGAATGLALGTGFSVAGAGIGAALQKTAQTFNNDARLSAISAKNKKTLGDVINSNAPLRRQVEKTQRYGIDPVDIVSQTDLLFGAVDKDGKINTSNAVNDVRELVKPYEGMVFDILKTEGRTVSKEEIRAAMLKNLEDSGIAGGVKTTVLNKIDDEIAGLAIDQNSSGRIGLDTVHNSKVTRGQRIKKAYLDPDSAEADKLITRTLKEIVEKNTQSADVQAINKELQKHYEVIDFLKRLDRKIVKGGRLGRYFAQTFGSVAGSKFGPLGAIAGAEIGGKIHGGMLSNTFGKAQGRGIEKSGLLKSAKEKLENTEVIIPPSRRLPEPAIRLPYSPKEGEQAYNSLGNRNTTQSTTISPTRYDISRTVAQNTDIVQPTQAEIRARLVSEGKQGVYGKPLLGLPSPDKTKSGVAIPMRQSTQFEKPASIIGGKGQTSGLPLKKAEQPKVTKRGLKKQPPTQAKGTPVEAQKPSKVKVSLLNSKSPDAALMAEAKKYKTAEEFVKAHAKLNNTKMAIKRFEIPEFNNGKELNGWRDVFRQSDEKTRNAMDKNIDFLLKDKSNELDPILVEKDGSYIYVVDGHHRVASYLSAGRESIPVQTVQDRSKFLDIYNKAHGK